MSDNEKKSAQHASGSYFVDENRPEEEIKPLANSDDFSDDWLGDLDDALEFDSAVSTNKGDSSSDEDIDIGEIEVIDANDTFNVDMDVFDEFETYDQEGFSPELGDSVEISFDDDTPSQPETPETPPPTPAPEKEVRRSYTAQTLDIVMLQQQAEKRLEDHTGEHADADPLKDPQLWQFVSLIGMRLFDDLELILVQKHSEEVCDLQKQMNRLANILAFAGLPEQLPLIAHIGSLLPITFTDVEIGQQSERKFDPQRMKQFEDKVNDFLNCLVYLLTYISKRSVGFDTARFTDSLEVLYSTLGLTPGQPSADAPLAVNDGINPSELTTRTVNKLSRTIEALVTESLHYIESAVFYGYASGFEDAAKSLNNACQVAREYKLSDFEAIFTEQYKILKGITLPNTPERPFYEKYKQVCALLQSHFSETISEKKIRHLDLLISKFNVPTEVQAKQPFVKRWSSFIRSALPLIAPDQLRLSTMRDRAKTLSKLAEDNDIEWICDILNRLDEKWEAFPRTSAEEMIHIADDLRSFPTEAIDEKDIEQINHESLQVLFRKKVLNRKLSAYTVVNDVHALAEDLLSKLETPEKISTQELEDCLINARLIECHAIERAIEILLSLLERVPRGDDAPPAAESVMNALCFTAGFLQNICQRLLKFIDNDPYTPAVMSYQLFYSTLLSLYQTPGKPRDGLIWFIVKRFNSILSELQLVWMNTSTPTSTEYYSSLIRSLLHLSTVCEMKPARHLLLEHLEDIPKNDFINTDNRSMSRQCARIIRAIEEGCPKISVLPGSTQVRLFFNKTIAALNHLLSSIDADNPEMLNSEISRIEARMSVLGMTTDFPPVIAFIFELHHLAYDDTIDRKRIEDMLYQMINVANNLCPEWVQPKDTDLEFVKASVPIPMTFFQEMLESLSLIYDSLELHAEEEPVAWERIQILNKNVRNLITYLPDALKNLLQNAQNRCRYLKKHIFINVNTNDYPRESELPVDSLRSVIALAFSTIIDRLLESIVDNAYPTTDVNSRIDVVLLPLTREFSATIVHNGSSLTHEEIIDKLASINIMPARDENILDLLVGSQELARTYPPVNQFKYILPILRQFNGQMTLTPTADGNTQISVSFKL
ncbi:MAG: hypothetical protein IJU23_03310 [Proteobacteria bacterium]|nr:hypothetical protein [Pseudomonadota bacterium]